MKPFTSDMIKKRPVLYPNSPNVRSADVDDALNGLKHEVTMMMDVDEDVKRLLFHHIDTWFPAFSKEDDSNEQS